MSSAKTLNSSLSPYFQEMFNTYPKLNEALFRHEGSTSEYSREGVFYFLPNEKLTFSYYYDYVDPPQSQPLIIYEGREILLVDPGYTRFRFHEFVSVKDQAELLSMLLEILPKTKEHAHGNSAETQYENFANYIEYMKASIEKEKFESLFVDDKRTYEESKKRNKI